MILQLFQPSVVEFLFLSAYELEKNFPNSLELREFTFRVPSTSEEFVKFKFTTPVSA